MKKAPAFQFYAKDWLSSANVRNMSMRHRGVYISVLAAMWDSDEPGTLPLPIKIATRSAGLDPRSLIDFVSKWPQCLVAVDGKLVNQKLRAQLGEIVQRQRALSDAGKNGNEKRWGNPSGGDSGGDRSAPAFASASASAEKESLAHAVISRSAGPKLQEPGPTRFQIEKVIGKSARQLDPASNGVGKKTAKELDERRRFLLDQAAEINRKHAN